MCFSAVQSTRVCLKLTGALSKNVQRERETERERERALIVAGAQLLQPLAKHI